VAGALLIPTGIASAASRGFVVKNDSTRTLRVVGASRVSKFTCVVLPGGVPCFDDTYAMAFEGRPDDGAQLRPGDTQRWELKYYFDVLDLFGTNYNYAAKLTYAIEGTAGRLEAEIKTANYSNHSTCQVIPNNLGSCTAAGVNITFR
jgi:hypothetical protein